MARLPHHEFAHELLPRAFFADPDGLLAALEADPRGYLRSAWAKCVARFPDEPPIPSEGPVAEVRALDPETTVACVTLPAPQALTEAYFVALVLRRPRKGWFGAKTNKASYLTLESGLWVDNQPRTFLGEWTADGAHLNHGTGPGPGREEFLNEVARLGK
jgi:hypothetical protein